MLKALVLAGGLPQIDLIIKLKKRGIYTLLADYYEHPVARDYADKFFRISTLDVTAIQNLAIREQVDFLITVCTDQALLTVAQVSEALKLPCYIDYETAKKVTNKAYMKRVMIENHIPTAKCFIGNTFAENTLKGWRYPLVVKPVDCNSSKGVVKVKEFNELRKAFFDAISLSRTNTAIIEEFIEGKELSVDVYVENGRVKILDITTSEKLKEEGKFIIFRTWHPAQVSETIRLKVEQVTQKIAEAFFLYNTPLLIQMLVNNENVYVIEFSARTGGGAKYFTVKNRSGFDIVDAVIDLTLGIKPVIKSVDPQTRYLIDDYVYCKPGIYDHIEGFDLLKQKGVILEYYIFKWKGAKFDSIENSGDRLCGFSIEADSVEELYRKHTLCNKCIKALSVDGEDLIRHDLLHSIDTINA